MKDTHDTLIKFLSEEKFTNSLSIDDVDAFQLNYQKFQNK